MAFFADDRAACAGMPTDDFYPDGGGHGAEQAGRAKAVCARCPVREACLAWALQHETGRGRFGIFGGTTPREREVLARQQPSRPRQRTRCVNGHRYTPENTEIVNGARRCRTCHNRRSNESKQRRAS